MDTINLLILITTVITLALGFLTFAKNKEGNTNRIFFALVIAIAAWSISMILFRSTREPSVALWGAYILYLSASFIPFLFVPFVYAFIGRGFSVRRKKLWLSLFAVLISIFAWPHGLILHINVAENGNHAISFGYVAYLYMLYFSAGFLWGILRLWKYYKKATGIKKIQAQYVLIGSIIPIFTGSLSNLFLPHFGYFTLNWLANVSIIFMPVFFAYAIIKHQLLNVRVIATELFTGLIIITAFVSLLLSDTTWEFMSNLLILITVTVFGVLLIRGTLREIKTLQELSDAKTEFVNIASHQLRTPLSILKGYLSIMKEGGFGELSTKQEEIVERVYLTNETMIRLVNDLLNVSRAEEGRLHYSLEKVDVRDIIKTVLEELALLANQNHLNLSEDMPEHPVPVYADKDKLREVILNLVDNALKYTSQGGVSIRVSLNTADKGFVNIYIIDTGIGLTGDEIAGLFQQFKRGRRGERVNAAGAGLGLFIAKKIIEDHGGKIWVESEGKNRGSTFIIKLPLFDEREIAEDAPAA